MSKKLVAYFSAQGITAKVAKNLAVQAGCDIFEIKPETPYTAGDIRWTNPLARCNKEKISKKDVPIAGKIKNFSDYDVVFIGFPIWYFSAPNIIFTFLKSYDWAGKKIALFATSGGSDISKAAEKVSSQLGESGEVVASKLFTPAVTKADLKQWAESIG